MKNRKKATVISEESENTICIIHECISYLKFDSETIKSILLPNKKSFAKHSSLILRLGRYNWVNNCSGRSYICLQVFAVKTLLTRTRFVWNKMKLRSC
ncbi:hypothetical protein V1477_018203 [Vespula maculifrons]|uniref:Uncharacterized protein n=1 Tax=Vespula maculifrons TaxID=7453 RepID=A0ABD2B154_VESMC